MTDDNTLDNAGEIGRDLADKLGQKMIEIIEGFPASSPAQRVAIARILSRNVDDYADELER